MNSARDEERLAEIDNLDNLLSAMYTTLQGVHYDVILQAIIEVASKEIKDANSRIADLEARVKELEAVK